MVATADLGSAACCVRVRVPSLRLYIIINVLKFRGEIMLFRFHRGSLQDSLGTTVSVESFEELERVVKDSAIWYIDKIRIIDEPIRDARLPQEWNGEEYQVMGNYFGQEVVVGFSSGKLEKTARVVRTEPFGFNLYDVVPCGVGQYFK